MIPLELINYLDTYEFEDYGQIRITSLKWQNGDFYLEIVIEFDNYEFYCENTEGFVSQKWQIRVNNLQEERVNCLISESIKIEVKHILLYKHCDPYLSLYFKSVAHSPQDLLFHLYKLHIEKFGNWFPFEEFLNGGSEGLFKLLSYDFGLFASAPEPIIMEYKQCLEGLGIKTSFPKSHIMKSEVSTIEIERMGRGKKMKILLLGTAYFIGEEFIFSRIE